MAFSVIDCCTASCALALSIAALSAFTVASVASACARDCSPASLETMPLCDELRLPLRRELLEFRGRGVAGELRFGLSQQRLIAGLVGLRLLQRRFERPRIDLEEQVALLDDVAFVEERLFDLAGDLRSDGNRRVRFDVADRGDVDRHVLLRHLGRDDRLRAAAAAPRPPRPPPRPPPAGEQSAAALPLLHPVVTSARTRPASPAHAN